MLPQDGPEEPAASPEYRVKRRSRIRTAYSGGASTGLFQPLPAWVWGWAIVLMLAGFVSNEPILTPVCILELPILASLLWFRGEPPVLFFCCAVQWLQVSIAVFYSDLHGTSLNEMFDAPNMTEATWLSLAGLPALALGMRLVLTPRPASEAQGLAQETLSLSLSKIFTAWLVAFGLAAVAGIAAWHFPGLTQLIYQLINLKWFFFFILAYSVLTREEGYPLLGWAVLMEFTTGLIGYFSGFKQVFLTLLLVIATLRSNTRLRFLAIVIGIITVIFSVYWTAIKSDYRTVLNQGSGDQKVAIPIADRLYTLGGLVSDVNSDELGNGVDALIKRVEYVSLFGYAIDHVPSHVPYERGKLWLGAITHVLEPRLFFPNKAVLNDSELTQKYTGLSVAGIEGGTSIGIGYMGESYIDFGPLLMFMPIFLLGALFGLIYRYLVSSNSSRLLGFALATATLFPAWQIFGEANTKIVGGTITVFLIMVGFNYIAGERIRAWLVVVQPLPRGSRRRIARTAPSPSSNKDSKRI
jgi:hypothetical protein